VTTTDSARDAAAATDVDALAARLAPSIVRVTRRIRPSRGDLSAGHFSTLATIQRLGPRKPGELARVERVSAPTMTRIVTALEDRGLVERRQCADDARSVTVAITDEGERLLQAARADQAAALAELLPALDDDQRATLVAALPALEAVAAQALAR
jgi:DNA-binding MarR family transcriptional regulator